MEGVKAAPPSRGQGFQAVDSFISLESSIGAVLFHCSDRGFRNKRGVIRPEASPSTHPSDERGLHLS